MIFFCELEDWIIKMSLRCGSGKVLGGYHKDIKGSASDLTPEANKITSMKFLSHVINGKKVNYITKARCPTFAEAEEIGTVMPRLCER